MLSAPVGLSNLVLDLPTEEDNGIIPFILLLPTLISLINVEGVQNLPKGWDFLEKKRIHNSNKRGVEGGKNLRNQ